jgi:hypothetical protein
VLFLWGSHPFMFSLCDLLGLVSSCKLATCGRLDSLVLGCDLHEHHALPYFSKWYLDLNALALLYSYLVHADE